MKWGSFVRKIFTLLIPALVFTSIFCQTVSANAIITETNLAGLNVSGMSSLITYNDGSTEIMPEDYIFLYINGSIIKNANIVIENSRTLVPLRLISETLGAKVDWDGTARKVTITDGSNKIELIIGNNKPTFNGKVIAIDVAPKIISDYTYVPLRFIAESLTCKVDWFDGTSIPKGDNTPVTQAHYPIGMRQVMVSRYPADTQAMNQSQAIEKLRGQLITAYEKYFSAKYAPLDVKPATWTEPDSVRYAIAHLSPTYENDRFFIIPMEWDFLIDKYTGTVLCYYNGIDQFIYLFDPNADSSLSFAG